MFRSGLGGWFQECKKRESREVCHQSFWCGEDRAHAINISPGGMCLRIARRAEPGEEVVLSHGPLYSVKGRIAWTRRLKTCTEIGIQFMDTQANMKNWIGFLKAEGVEDQTPGAKEEKLLALPAPEHTRRPVTPISLNPPQMKMGARVGRSWQTAARMMGPG